MAMVKAVFVAVVAVAALAQLATAVDYTVGGNGAKWDAGGTNYDAWSAKQKFTTKDSLGKQLFLSSPVQLAQFAGWLALRLSRTYPFDKFKSSE